MRKFVVKLFSGKIMIQLGEDYELFGDKWDTCVIWRWKWYGFIKKKIKVATYYDIDYIKELQPELAPKKRSFSVSGREFMEEAEEF